MPATPPPPDRFRPGDTWADRMQRPHRVEECSTKGLVNLVAIDDELPTIAVSAGWPMGFQRLQWGGHP